MSVEALYWREPAWLWLALLPLLWLLIGSWRRRRHWRAIADAELLPWLQAGRALAGNGRARLALLVAWLLLSVAIAGPRTVAWTPPGLLPAGGVVVVLDLSASMSARDVLPDRRQAAASAVSRWLAASESQPVVGLVIYAGTVHTLLPPGHDRQVLRRYLAEVAALRPPVLGNALGTALQRAQSLLRGVDGEPRILLLSDGDIGSAAAQAALQSAAGLAAPLLVVGVGAEEPVPVYGVDAAPLLLDGQAVVSRRHTHTLQALAQAASDGEYLSLSQATPAALNARLSVAPPRLAAAQTDTVIWREWFAVPLLAALLLLASAASAPGRRVLAMAGVMALTPGLLLPQDAAASAAAATALQQHQYAEARRLFAAEQGFAARFGEATACYRLADYRCAERAFAAAAWQAPDTAARARAVFNLGNVMFQLADYAQAAVLFRDAGRLGIDAARIERNLAFAVDLAAAVQRHLADREATLRRADWRAAAGEQPQGFADRLADDVYLSDPALRQSSLRVYSAAQRQRLLAAGIARQQAAGTTQAQHWGWVQSSGAGTEASTASLLNEVMAREAGLPNAQREPSVAPGQQAW